MRSTTTIFAILLTGLLLSVAAGCKKPSASPQLTATLTPTPVPATRPPQPSDIRLSFPSTITRGDTFVVGVTNEGSVPYAYYMQHPSDNCLVILDDTGRIMPTIPGETCDALAENIIRPGQSREFSNWDLKKCAVADCLRRDIVAPGLYHFSATFYPSPEDGSISNESSFTFEEPFTILPASN